jgi:hypothetical protein
MKPQDILFLLILAFLVFKRKPRLIIVIGLSCIFVAIPLFYFQVFFTAQRLISYAALLVFVAIVFMLRKEK